MPEESVPEAAKRSQTKRGGTHHQIKVQVRGCHISNIIIAGVVNTGNRRIADSTGGIETGFAPI